MVNHKLAIIVPYRDRRDHLDIFIPHMKEFLKDKGISYKIFVVEQADDKPFNYGKLCNAAFSLIKDDFDYFCFHDVDQLPINDSCDYSYKDYPLHLATRASAHNDRLPYLQYFGGVVLFTKEDFEKINGYSNEYYGWGYGDIDLLFRSSEKELDVDYVYAYPKVNSEYEVGEMQETDSLKSEKIHSIKFDGETFLEIKPNKFLKDLTTDSFTVSMWIKPEDNLLKQQYILSWPGFNSGISLNLDNQLIFNFWNSQKIYYYNYKKIKPNEWNHLIVNINFDDNKLKMWLNGIELQPNKDASVNFKTPLYDYSNSNIYIGCGSINKEFYTGELSNLYMFDYTLTPGEIEKLYLNGLYSNKFLQTKFEPVLRYEFDNFYKQYFIDKSKTHNHAKVFGKAGTDYLKLVSETTIQKVTEIPVPHRVAGEYQSLEHEGDLDIKDKFNGFDPDTLENKKIFFEDIFSKKFSTDKIGLSSLKFKLIENEEFNDKTNWIKVIL